MVEIDYNALAIIGILAFLTIYGVERFTKHRFQPKPEEKKNIHDDQTERIKLLKQDKEELINEIKSIKQKFNRYVAKEAPTIEGDPETVDIGEAVKKLAPKFKDLLPKEFQGLVDDPDVVQYIAELANEHPDEAKEFLKQFIKGSVKQPAPNAPSGSEDSSKAPVGNFA